MQSWPFGNSIEKTIENIHKDIAAFANLNSLRITPLSPGKVNIDWEDRRSTKSAKFAISNDRIMVEFNGGTPLPYRDFLASDYMADLNFTAQRILDIQRKKDYIVRSKAKCNEISKYLDELIDNAISSPKVTREKGENKFIDYTKILFIRGQAGSGKTIAMENISRTIAEEYLKGRKKYLLFYIDAQGRSLTRIDDAISYVVGNYSLVFQPNAIKTLARNSLVIPIIDGFDELIGAGGFSDAFKSLSTLLASLERQGAIIATGRSTFYDENILAIAASAQSGNDGINYEIEDIIISPWDDEDISGFIENKYQSEEIISLLKKNTAIIRNNSSNEIFRKPFYLTRILDEMASGYLTVDEPNTSTPSFDETWYLTKAMDGYLEREMLEKFKDRSGKPILAKEDHILFLQELALELWWQEKRTIDNETIRSIAEMVLEEKHIDAELWPIFIGKVSSYSFFKTSDSSKEKEFESQIYFDYFLSLALHSMLNTQKAVDIRQFLDRSLLDESTIDYYKILLKNEKAILFNDLVHKVNEAANLSFTGSLSKRNAGTIISAIMQSTSISDVTIKEIDFYGVCFDRQIQNVIFSNCYFREIKIYSEFIKCTLTNCTIHTVYTVEETSFEGTFFSSNTVVSRIISPDKEFSTLKGSKLFIEKTLGGVFERDDSNFEMSEKQKNIFKLLEKFLEKTKRKFQFDLEPDSELNLRDIFHDHNWSTLLDMLISTGIIEKRNVDRSGRYQYLYMITESPDDLLTSLQEPVFANTKKIKKFVELFNTIN